MDGDGGEERRRRPEAGVLHELVRRGWAGLASQQTLPKHLEAEVRRYLGCGQLLRGALVDGLSARNAHA